MNSDLFERFLDNLEIYLDLRKSIQPHKKMIYDVDYGTDTYWRLHNAIEEQTEVIDNQRDVLQMLFEKMVGEDGSV